MGGIGPVLSMLHGRSIHTSLEGNQRRNGRYESG